ncbi:HNH homing endonuclease [Pseudomonas phage phiH1]|uniref:HNH homing endonuclease n=1 Tax=Pseudomonas phage phiH1 TaxID=2982871 RepID=A0AAX3D3I5_9CAUD|nr:HNH homing endonuclease [Pseudomonas phage phiH1]UYD21576.1 HNH homing endonuclease [Pseudomonas phage phiH1]WGH15463.1 hypothetical protein [Pseudomonas phage PA_LZ02]
MGDKKCTACGGSGHTAANCPWFKGYSLTDGFKLAVQRIARTGCWHWRGGRDVKTGEPRCHRKGKRVRAALVAWEAVHGALPVGQRLVRACGDSTCVNPAHHFHEAAA